MPNLYKTRAARASDIPYLAVIADATLFPGEMLEGMIAPALTEERPDIWRMATQGENVVGFAFAQPEAMTNAAWNLRAIAVSPELYGSGAGTALIGAMESALKDARMIVVDTTQTSDQARARRFYKARGYVLIATIPDFFDVGEDKVTFVKTLR
ncbi:GNAT family N-acetyltransferase [Tateyamaria pelophila]|uniref:GNAT family N-acetyltransferase n=1 Tax=Tateyamaria pelophila TaxID=328415 RepID=UPI001CBC5455|nr:GNAT family N-acetyltransferase [Tateyamaria pelophila]